MAWGDMRSRLCANAGADAKMATATAAVANRAAQHQNLPNPHPDMVFFSVLIAAISCCLPVPGLQLPPAR
jgi:hypothetical protein